jgi:hypothetical protein
MSDNHQKANAAPRCQFIRLNDQRCTQPALTDQVFCRFHDLVDRPLMDARLIPFVEDATTLQLALMQVIRSVQLGQTDRRTAGTILYALQIAAGNLKHFSEENGHPFAQPNAARKSSKKEDEDDIPGPSLAELLLERLAALEEDEDDTDDESVILSEDAAKSAPDSGAHAASESKDLLSPPRPSAFPAVKKEPGTIEKLEACVDPFARKGRNRASFHRQNKSSLDFARDDRTKEQSGRREDWLMNRNPQPPNRQSLNQQCFNR